MIGAMNLYGALCDQLRDFVCLLCNNIHNHASQNFHHEANVRYGTAGIINRQKTLDTFEKISICI